MSSRSDILAQIAAVGDAKAALERDMEATESYTRHMNEQRMAQEDILRGSYDESTKAAAQREHDYLVEILAELYERQRQGYEEMQRLRDAERTLAISLRSAR
ncbi:hypothetical protein FGADI_7971 [Fusarium gaditjirri]|uniref:Uncharacterized protein n=1 Tax=Fusarium gaditjirri TaxID=282569 RepID=A0A8H4T3Q5_9HYPO|nr:hypothetical protein FGADI_7971 [Fusarium gaditjirri]